jgi:hypothetical protein
MATVSHLGLIPNFCYPDQEQVTWRQIFESEIVELGAAPESAYLKLTKQQIDFLFWRVKEWEITWGWNSKSISSKVTFDLDPELTQDYTFSYPQASWTKTLIAPQALETANEKKLVCEPWYGAVPVASFGFNEFSITSKEVQNNPSPSLPENFDHSRDLIVNEMALSFAPSAGGYGVSFDFDVAWVPNYKTGLFYWPFTIELNIEISNSTTDNLLFAEEEDSIGGSLPPIVGRLTSNNLNDNSLEVSNYKAKLYLYDGEFIEIPLFDKTEPSAKTETKFNVDGFTGIEIKPKLYWAYDPDDGGGPIYDSTTGEQLRSFSTD